MKVLDLNQVEFRLCTLPGRGGGGYAGRRMAMGGGVTPFRRGNSLAWFHGRDGPI